MNTQFDNLIDKIMFTLTKEKIPTIKFDFSEKIKVFKNDPNIRALVLSSVNKASGIDLSFVSNIIILEPIIGSNLFLRDIEKQIIGRIYRIGQQNNINVYRFIIKNTIEEIIFNENLN